MVNQIFKFRIWDYRQNKLDYSPLNSITSDGRIFYGNADFSDYYGPIQRYIGINDKYGKEIYEGDIIRITDLCAIESFGDSHIMKVYTRSWIVEWDRISFKVKYYNPDQEYETPFICNFPLENVEYEIIGNIFEGIKNHEEKISL